MDQMSFNCLPCELKEKVFSYVSHEDRFEAAKVCQQWFFATIRSYRNCFKEGDELLRSLALFYNQAMLKSPQGTWYTLIKYPKFEKAVLYEYGSEVIERILRRECPTLKHLVLSKRKPYPLDALQDFPNLSTVTIKDFMMSSIEWGDSRRATLLEDYLVPLNLTNQLVHSSHILPSFTMRIPDGEVESRFLSKLVLDLIFMGPPATMNILEKIVDCPTLGDITMIGAVIDTRWNKLFPSNFRRISLLAARVDEALAEQNGFPNCCGRSVLLYCCEHWKFMERFHLNAPNHGIDYKCLPIMRLESVSVKLSPGLSPKLESPLFTCTKLEVAGIANELQEQVPKSVKDLFLYFDSITRDFSPYDVCIDPTMLRSLKVASCNPSVELPSVAEGSFNAMSLLTTLELDNASSGSLSTIIGSCPCLQTMKLRKPKAEAFRGLPPSVSSDSIEELVIDGGHDSLHDIIQHFSRLKKLVLKNHKAQSIESTEADLLAGLTSIFIHCEYSTSVCFLVNQAPQPFKCIACPTKTSLVYMMSADANALRQYFHDLEHTVKLACIMGICIRYDGLHVNRIERFIEWMSEESDA